MGNMKSNLSYAKPFFLNFLAVAYSNKDEACIEILWVYLNFG